MLLSLSQQLLKNFMQKSRTLGCHDVKCQHFVISGSTVYITGLAATAVIQRCMWSASIKISNRIKLSMFLEKCLSCVL